MLETLEADPFLYWGGELVLRLDSPPGGAHHYHNSQDPEPNAIMPREATKDLMMDEARSSSAAKIDRAPRVDTSSRSSTNRCASTTGQLPDEQNVIQRFLQNRQAAKIPDFDLQDHPLYNTWLYWPTTSQG
jgi:hypothetical protein